jgi:hypothetical protein
MQVFVFARRNPGASLAMLAITVCAIVLLVIVSCPTLLAQGHGMRATARPVRIGTRPPIHPGFSTGHTGMIRGRPLGHRPFLVQRFPFRHHRRFNFFLANACSSDPFFDPFLCQRFFRNSLFLAQPLFLPYPVYADTSYAAPEDSGSAEQYEQADLSARIDRLTDDVERLREQQESARNPQERPSQGNQAAEADPPTRILVFRDGHRSEIRNYAMVGNTLWVLTQERATKIAVSDLDMTATKKANADQGIEFP